LFNVSLRSERRGELPLVRKHALYPPRDERSLARSARTGASQEEASKPPPGPSLPPSSPGPGKNFLRAGALDELRRQSGSAWMSSCLRISRASVALAPCVV